MFSHPCSHSTPCESGYTTGPLIHVPASVFSSHTVRVRLYHGYSDSVECAVCVTLVSGVVAHVFSLHEHVDLSERGSARLVPVPALAHQVEYLLGTVVRLRQTGLEPVAPVTVSSTLYHLLVCELCVRLLLSEREHLPQRHSERPHVTLGGKLTL